MFKKIKYKLTDFILGNLIDRGVFKKLSDKQMVIVEYFITFGRVPNLTNPLKFSEKMEWIKLYGSLERYRDLVDKYEVRSFIRKQIGVKHLVPLIGVWEKLEDINFNKLPKRFVLKATHGSGHIFVCKDKSKINKEELKKTWNKRLSENWYSVTREIQYKEVHPKIICEKYLEDESGGLTDYKIQCFNGRPHLIEVHLDRYTNHRTVFMDLKWNRLPMRIDFEPLVVEDKIERPGNLNEMIEISKKLSKNLPFVRVDLYSVKNKTYFGELTFIPNNGLLVFDPPQVEYELGKLIDLSPYKI